MGQMGRKRAKKTKKNDIDKNYLPRSSLISENRKKGAKKERKNNQHMKRYTAVALYGIEKNIYTVLL